VIESPQFGFILATGLDQDQGRLHKIVKNKSLFCNIEFLEFLGEIGFFEPGKMSLADPFVWQISTFMAWSMGNGKKRLFMGPSFFRGRIVQLRKVPVATGEPADGERN